ncbi:hypothetical protein KKE19_02655 [Patescibacteria group bacterium]|nr:hypothetical protein [Patescibacteria group bacterium]MBU4274691.1 hypothetical protein [Patescibacteria group bacterium]MBU4367737.1 hypothetical protein [Patescibacteria group bacterium]MBU4461813.1 hypothetical protein [Patescibacteria group bacterium]MCG2700056.1 hypothetical protein [Candidatus Parcubacteria bacterium]
MSETKGKNPTLAERLTQRLTQLSEKKTPSIFNLPTEISIEFCTICKTPRLDSDPTGVTCGKSECLSRLGAVYNRDFNSVKQELFSIANDLGLSPEELTGDGLITLCKNITKEIKLIKSTVEGQ